MQEDIAQKITTFFGQYRQHTYEKGHVLARPGTDPDAVWHLVSGQVRQYDIAPNGDEVVVNVFKPPAFFPMSWAINHTSNEFFFETSEPTVLHKAPAADVVQFLHDNPDVTFNLLARVYKGTDGLLGRMAYLMQNSARNRVIYELMVSAKRFGAPRGAKIEIPLHETELAARVGLTRETTNREIHKLKDDGLVEVSQSGIIIKDLGALTQTLANNE